MYKRAINLTKHTSNEKIENIEIISRNPAMEMCVKKLLTFQQVPSKKYISDRAEELAEVAIQMSDFSRKELSKGIKDEFGFRRHQLVWIDGVSFLMGPLEKALKHRGFQPVHRIEHYEEEEDLHSESLSSRRTIRFVYT